MSLSVVGLEEGCNEGSKACVDEEAVYLEKGKPRRGKIHSEVSVVRTGSAGDRFIPSGKDRLFPTGNYRCRCFLH